MGGDERESVWREASYTSPQSKRSEAVLQALPSETQDLEGFGKRRSSKIHSADAARVHDLRTTISSVNTNSWVYQNCPLVITLVCSTRFNSMVGVMILLNCCTVGIEVDLCAPKESPRHVGENEISDICPADAIAAGEHFFTAFFVVEFFLRVAVFGFTYYLKSGQNFFDAVLVWVTGVLTTWILAPMNLGSGSLRMFTILRVFRLFRVARVVRSNPEFKEMWLLIKGLADSMRTLFWTVIVMLFVNYVFGVFAVLVIGDSDAFTSDPDSEALIQSYFKGVPEALFTMLQVVTGDSWASGVARPVMKFMPPMWLFFVLYVGVAMFVLLNLITAVIVDNALTISSQDEELRLKDIAEAKQKELHKLSKLFTKLDTDGSGALGEDEFEQACEVPEVRNKLLLLNFEESEIKYLFNDLDDGDGMLTIEEFVEGIHKMQGEAQSKDVVKVQRSLERLHRRLDAIESVMGIKPAVSRQRSDRYKQFEKKTRSKSNLGAIVPGKAVDDPEATPAGNSFGSRPSVQSVASDDSDEKIKIGSSVNRSQGVPGKANKAQVTGDSEGCEQEHRNPLDNGNKVCFDVSLNAATSRLDRAANAAASVCKTGDAHSTKICQELDLVFKDQLQTLHSRMMQIVSDEIQNKLSAAESNSRSTANPSAKLDDLDVNGSSFSITFEAPEDPGPMYAMPVASALVCPSPLGRPGRFGSPEPEFRRTY